MLGLRAFYASSFAGIKFAVRGVCDFLLLVKNRAKSNGRPLREPRTLIVRLQRASTTKVDLNMVPARTTFLPSFVIVAALLAGREREQLD